MPRRITGQDGNLPRPGHTSTEIQVRAAQRPPKARFTRLYADDELPPSLPSRHYKTLKSENLKLPSGGLMLCQ